MKQNIFKIAILSFVLFLTSEAKAAIEFTWSNSTCNTMTVTVKDETGATIYSSSTPGGTCLTGAATIEVTDGCGRTYIYNTLGEVINTPGTGCFCNSGWIPFVTSCGPAGMTCGPGAILFTMSI